jgi:hypothetical protein
VNRTGKAWIWLAALWSVAAIAWITMAVIHTVTTPESAQTKYEECLTRSQDNYGQVSTAETGICAKIAGLK